jgi:L-alanine-DL-glutamate epimerase-like enolase superfamily enzyme
MIDPTWVGGISETKRIADMAQAYNIPVTMHDCTGPLTLIAGLHLNAALPGACYQETVRAQIQTVYKDLIDYEVDIQDGFLDLPRKPGLGVSINPDFFKDGRADYRVTR